MGTIHVEYCCIMNKFVKNSRKATDAENNDHQSEKSTLSSYVVWQWQFEYYGLNFEPVGLLSSLENSGVVVNEYHIRWLG